MNTVNLERSAAGDVARIGTFYDARNDLFLPLGLFEDDIPPDAIQTNSISTHRVQLDQDDSYKSKFRMLGVSTSLAATILAGLLECKGALRLLEEPQTFSSAWAALYHTFLTMEEKLNFRCPALQDCLESKPLQNVTHIVAEVKWGLRSVLTAHCPDEQNGNTGHFKSQMVDFEAAVKDFPSSQGRNDCYMLVSDEPLDIMVYSDVFSSNGVIMEDLGEAFGFFKILPLHAKDSDGGKGVPVTYTLVPIDFVALFLQEKPPPLPILSLPSEEYLRQFITIFDKFQSYRQQFTQYTSFVASRKQFLFADQAKIFESKLQQLLDAEHTLKARFPVAIRNARHNGDQSELHQLLNEYDKGDSSLDKIAEIDPCEIVSITMLDELVSKGVTYVGDNDTLLAREREKHRDSGVYVLHYDRYALSGDTDEYWRPSYDRFSKLVEAQIAGAPISCAIYDTSGKGSFDNWRISCFQSGEEITPDLLEYERFMNERCFARCPGSTFETEDIHKPIKRRFMKVPCPSPDCDHKLDCNWNCPECLETIEYGYTDDYLYCNCGRSKVSNYDFRCNAPSHGPGFVQYDPTHLIDLLRNLGSSNYVNVLILGETGVGKSTFINAMINYLQFTTLDGALAHDDLHWVIPCSFSTQFMDRDRPDAQIEERFVRVGSRDDEKDGSKGDSATQRTTVYPVKVSSDSTTYTVRLIDTPGIGDTRGPDFDKKNMMDILATISSYDELHGILILLKPNNARLTITFQYCVKELLVHLHQNAARNMVFGFTNTRITNYTPGDTFQPLKRLLGENTSVGISLTASTTYCFDSESFRYLAAYKNGTEMPNKGDFDRSWENSRRETTRLIDHFRSVAPHLTKSTMSLNGARRSIQELTKPMADISEMIRKSIALCTDKKAELKDKKLTNDQLLANLHIEKIQLEPVGLDRPRTVCCNMACTEVRDDGKGTNTKVTVYKTHCHAPCYLDHLPCDVQAPPGIIYCAAFLGSEKCSHCKHHWSEHMHVIYELKEYTVTVKDKTIEQQLKSHADEMSLRQTGIARLDETVKEYEQEKEIIRNAAAKFGVFLKHHSMSPINDATEGYLNFRIKAEEDKVSVGGNNTQLKALREDLLRHKQEMEVLTRALNSTTTAEAEDLTEAGVERTIRRLYQLKHFGKNLQTLQKGIMFAYEAGNREIPLSVKRNPVNASGRRPRKLEICSPTQFHNPSDGSRPSFAERQRANGNGDSTVTRFVKKSWSSMFG